MDLERQMGVWVPVGAVLAAAGVGLVFGHAPGSGRAAPGATGGAQEVAVVAEAAEPVRRTPPPPPPREVEEEPGELVQAAITPPPEEIFEEAPEAIEEEAPIEEVAPEEVAPEEVAPEEVAPVIEKTGDGPTGVVTGRVVFRGKLPEPVPDLVVPAPDKPGCCADEMIIRDRGFVVSEDGGVEYAVVEIQTKEEVDGTGETIVMDQKCCRFEPHVLALPQGAIIRYDNSDGVTHNVHTYSRKNKSINNNLSGKTSYEVRLEKGETFRVGCDIHPWMNSFVHVAESPYFAVSGPDGSFEIEGVPPGEYKVTVWHESGRSASGNAEVVAGGRTTLELQLAEGKKAGGRRGR